MGSLASPVDDGRPTPPAGRALFTRRSYAVVGGAIFAVYALVALVMYVWRGVYFTPDLPDSWAFLLLIGAIALGRWKSFLRDWAPLIALIFGYEMLRGFADSIISRDTMTPTNHGWIIVKPLVDADKWLFGGTDPSVWLQARFYTPGNVHWYDTAAGLVYSLHFALPLVFGYLLWMSSRDRFRRFALTLLAMTYGTFVIYLLAPTAPPWLASQWGYLGVVHDPMQQAASALLPAKYAHFDTMTIFTKASPNPVAAFPSLHAAYPWLVMLFLVKFYGRKGWLFLIYNAAVWFTIVYLGQHWVVDAIAGALWATGSFLLMEWVFRRLERRRAAAADETTPAPALAPSEGRS